MSIQKISEEEVRSLWVQRLPDTPNRLGRFGTAGLSAAEMKAAYDALPLRIVEHFNALVELIGNGRLTEELPSVEGKSLAGFFRDVTSGALADYLTVDGVRSLRALAAALDSHDHAGLYAELDADGRLPAAYLPSGLEGAYAEAEKDRAAAEEERAAAEEARQRAEEERGVALSDFADRLTTAEERESERDRRESDRETRLSETEAELASTARHAENAAIRTAALSAAVENLSAAASGVTHTFYEDGEDAYRKEPPAGCLPNARLVRLGGEADGGVAPVKAVVSHGVNLLPYPYPSAAGNKTPSTLSIHVEDDGSILLDGYTDYNLSFNLYRDCDSLSLPTEPIYIDGIREDGLILYLRVGSSGTVWKTGVYTPSTEDEYFGHYYVYLNIAAGSRFEKRRVIPSITRGATPRKAVPYRQPIRFAIPDEVRALPAYGRYGNYLDFEDGCYHQQYDPTGQPLAEAVRIPLDPAFVASAWLPVEKDGYLIFENEKQAPVASRILYGIRL